MSEYAVFLRGVNVGGVNLKMAEVADALTDAGFTAVRTVLATGNVLLESSGKAAAVRTKAEATLRERFGYDAWVLVYDVDTVRAVVGDYPFEAEVDGYQSYVTFVSSPDVLDELAALSAGPKEKISRGDGVIYWQVPKGSTLDSTIGKTMGKPRYKSSTTTRNVRTLAKLLQISAAEGG
ncbi:pyridoxamine 5-phosphate oxidase [Mycobacterium sp. 1100029.7]|nr:pyridoxamine 5-phosphate oxidase [Mycobacterium sp. 1100029.7]